MIAKEWLRFEERGPGGRGGSARRWKWRPRQDHALKFYTKSQKKVLFPDILCTKCFGGKLCSRKCKTIPQNSDYWVRMQACFWTWSRRPRRSLHFRVCVGEERRIALTLPDQSTCVYTYIPVDMRSCWAPWTVFSSVPLPIPHYFLSPSFRSDWFSLLFYNPCRSCSDGQAARGNRLDISKLKRTVPYEEGEDIAVECAKCHGRRIWNPQHCTWNQQTSSRACLETRLFSYTASLIRFASRIFITLDDLWDVRIYYIIHVPARFSWCHIQ